MLFRIVTFILLISQLTCVSIVLDQIAPTQGIYFKETVTQKALGASVSGIGDINGDGINDVIIGAPSSRSGIGDAYVIYGGESVPSVLDFSVPFAPEIGFTIKGSITKANLGFWVSGAGDINGDGISDLVVSAPNAVSYPGIVYVIYGSKTRTSDVDLSVPLNPQTEGFTINGVSIQDRLGSSVSCAGDVNGDGISDIIIGAPNINSKGCAYVIYGSKTRQANIDILALTQTEGFSMCGTVSNGQFAKIVSGAGDVNGDGVADMIIGVPMAESYKGKVYVIFGKKGGLLNMNFGSGFPTPDVGFTVTGKGPLDFGSSVSKVGDINGDQIDDIIIGSPSEKNGIVREPKAYLIFGRKTGLVNIDLGSSGLSANQGLVIAGPTGNSFATFVSGAGDFNGDGFADVFLGSPSMLSTLGVAHILYGKFLSNVAVSSPADLSTCSYFEGAGLISMVGSSASSIGDFNMDGIDDIIMGTRNAWMAYGVAHIIFGSSNSWDEGGYLKIIDGCPKYCKTCDPISMACLSCYFDYGVQDSVCQKCPDGTHVSSNDNTCVTNTIPTSIICAEECKECISETVCKICKEGYTLVNSQKCVSSGLSAQANATAALFDSVSIISQSLAVGSSAPTNFGFVAKIVKNIRYLNITVSDELQSAFYTWKTRSSFMGAPQSWSSKQTGETLPAVFERYQIESSFLINYWRSLIMALIGLGLFAIFKAIDYAYSRSSKPPNWVSAVKSVNVSASNFALAQIYTSLDDIIFFFTLDVKGKGVNSAFANFSFALGIMLLISGVLVLAAHIYTIWKYQQFKKKANNTGDNNQLSKFVKGRENVKMLYQDFQDNTFPQQVFLFVNASRSMLTSLFVVTLFEYPLLQVLIFTAFSLCMLIYLHVVKPFKDLINTCAQYFCEVLLFVVNLCMLIMGFMDEAESKNETAVNGLSKTILIFNLTLIIGSALFMVASIVKALWTLYKERKLAKNKSLQEKDPLASVVKPRANNNYENRKTDNSQIQENYHWQQGITANNNFQRNSRIEDMNSQANYSQYLNDTCFPLQAAPMTSSVFSHTTVGGGQEYPSNQLLEEPRYTSNYLEQSPQKRPKILRKPRTDRRKASGMSPDLHSIASPSPCLNNIRKGTLDQEDLSAFVLPF